MSRTVLVVAAHPDDEVLGCGATMARHADSGDRVVCIILGEGETSRHGSREQGLATEARVLDGLQTSAERAAAILGTSRLETYAFPDNRFDSVPLLDIVKVVESVFSEERPELVYTHHSGDVNVDHVRTHEALLAVCRPLPGTSVSGLYFFEVPSSTEWRPPGSGSPFLPNHMVDVTTTIDRKVAALEAYAQEIRPFPHPRSAVAARALATWRGATAGVAAAEAFVVGRQLR